MDGVATSPPAGAVEKILAAIDGSDQAWKALDLAADMAQQHGAQLIVLHVVRFEPLPDALRAFAEAERVPVEEEEGRYRYARSLGDQLTRSAEARAREKGVSAVVGRTLDGKPAELTEMDAMVAYLQILGRLTDAAHKSVAAAGK